MHLSCAICAETIGPSDDLSVTRCGHMFHTACMATWLARVKNCPQCRNRCTTDNMVRLYLNVSLNDTISEQDSSTMQGQIDTLQINMRELKVQFKNRESELSVLKESQKMARKTIVGLETQLEQKEMLLKSNLEVVSSLNIIKNISKKYYNFCCFRSLPFSKRHSKCRIFSFRVLKSG